MELQLKLDTETVGRAVQQAAMAQLSQVTDAWACRVELKPNAGAVVTLTDTTTDGEFAVNWDGPDVLTQIALLSIKRSEAIRNRNYELARQLGESLIDAVKNEMDFIGDGQN